LIPNIHSLSWYKFAGSAWRIYTRGYLHILEPISKTFLLRSKSGTTISACTAELKLLFQQIIWLLHLRDYPSHANSKNAEDQWL